MVCATRSSGCAALGGVAVPPGRVAGEVLQEVCPGGLKLLAVHAQPEEPAPEGVRGVVGGVAGRARRAHTQRLKGNGHAELDVALNLARVERAVEGPEFDGAFLPHRVEVQHIMCSYT